MPSKCDSILMYMAREKKGGGYSLLARVRSENEGSEQNQLKFDYTPNKMSSSVNKITMGK